MSYKLSKDLLTATLKALCIYDLMHLGTHIDMFVMKERHRGTGDTDLNFLETNAAN